MAMAVVAAMAMATATARKHYVFCIPTDPIITFLLPSILSLSSIPHCSPFASITRIPLFLACFSLFLSLVLVPLSRPCYSLSFPCPPFCPPHSSLSAFRPPLTSSPIPTRFIPRRCCQSSVSVHSSVRARSKNKNAIRIVEESPSDWEGETASGS